MFTKTKLTWDTHITPSLHTWSIDALRITLGLVFIWFGILKIIDHSPVLPLIQSTYSFVPLSAFMMVLGVWETLIGLGLLTKIMLRTTVVLLLLQMGGVFTSLLLNPAVFFVDANPFLLTLEGEFLAKNLVLIAAALVVGGHCSRSYAHR